MNRWPVTIVQDDINNYAAVSGDVNPLHIDPEFAKTTSYGSTIAHGPITVALISRYLAEDMKFAHRIAGITVKFIAPVRPHDSLHCGAEEVPQGGSENVKRFNVWCKNQRNEQVAAGSATIRMEISQ